MAFQIQKKNNAFITPWTFLHFYSGLLFSLFTIAYTNLKPLHSFLIYSVLHLIYECKDFTFTYLTNIKFTKKNNFFGFLDNHNTLINSLGDQIFGMIGWYIGYLLFKNMKIKYNRIFGIVFAIIGILLVILFNKNKLG